MNKLDNKRLHCSFVFARNQIFNIQMKQNNHSLIYILIAVLSWSTVASAFKIALREVNYFELLLISSLTALFVFFIVLLLQGKIKLLSKIDVKVWFGFALIGLLNPTAYYLVLFKSYALLPAQIAQPINYFWPIILVVMLAIVLKEKIQKYKYIGMFVSFVGVVLISFGAESLSGVKLSKMGILLAFLSAFLWASFWIVNRRNQKIDYVIALFLSFLFGSFYLLLASLFVPVSMLSAKALLSSVYVGLFEMAIPFIFFGMALRKTNNPALINQLCYLSPFISLFIIHLVLGETIYPTTYLGLLLIILGILLNEWIGKRREKSKL